MHTRIRWVVLVIASGATACGDEPLLQEPMAPTAPMSTSTTLPQTQPGRDIPTIDRFHLALRAEGTFRPGQPVRISVDAVANLATEAAVLTVTLPEAELARASSWDRGFSYRSSGALRPALTRSLPGLGRGAASHAEATVTLPAGYYRVVAKLTPTEASPMVFNGHWIRNTAFAEAWLLITEMGGLSTAAFDTARIPDGMLNEPGPFRPTPPAPSGGGPEVPARSPSPDLAEAGTASVSGSITYHATYYDNDLGRYAPVPEARYNVYKCTTSEGDDACDLVLTESGWANSYGDISFGCDGDEYEIHVSTYAGSALFQVGHERRTRFG